MTIAGSALTPAEFRYWRKAVHNALAYQRRRSRWWRHTGIWGWWNGLGLRGVVSLGSVTTAEFMIALRRHGKIHLRPIAIETVRAEVYRAAQSVSISQRNDAAGRYQPVKIAIEPMNVTMSPMSNSNDMVID